MLIEIVAMFFCGVLFSGLCYAKGYWQGQEDAYKKDGQEDENKNRDIELEIIKEK